MDFFFFSSRRRHTRCLSDWSSDVCSSDLSRADAYRQCGTGAVNYLGDDFHLGLFDMYLVLPSDNAWSGGAPWFRCDIVRFRDAERGDLADTGSVKDGLRGVRPMVLTCTTVTDDGKGNFTDEQLTDCAKPHNSELAGLYTAPNIPWPGDAKTRKNMASKGCEGVVARFLGFTSGTVDSPYLGWEFSGFRDRDLWNLGDRPIQCSALG